MKKMKRIFALVITFAVLSCIMLPVYADGYSYSHNYSIVRSTYQYEESSYLDNVAGASYAFAVHSYLNSDSVSLEGIAQSDDFEGNEYTCAVEIARKGRYDNNQFTVIGGYQDKNEVDYYIEPEFDHGFPTDFYVTCGASVITDGWMARYYFKWGYMEEYEMMTFLNFIHIE